MAIINKSTSAGEDVEKRGPWCTVGGKVEVVLMVMPVEAPASQSHPLSPSPLYPPNTDT